MTDSDDEALEIINEMRELTTGDAFKEKMKMNPQLSSVMIDMAEEILRAAGTTEYSVTDHGYTGDQVLEKYRNTSSRAWNNKTAKKNHTKQITSEDIHSKASVYEKKKKEYKLRRSRMKALESDSNKELTTECEKQKTKIYSHNTNDEEDEEDSDDEIFLKKYLENIER